MLDDNNCSIHTLFVVFLVTMKVDLQGRLSLVETTSYSVIIIDYLTKYAKPFAINFIRVYHVLIITEDYSFFRDYLPYLLTIITFSLQHSGHVTWW